MFRTFAVEVNVNECILIIDPQNDFHEGGSLAVPNANDDAKRIANLLRMRRKMPAFVTMDTHDKEHHIFLADSWQVVESGKSPPPFTVITYENNNFIGNCKEPLLENKIVNPLVNNRERHSKKNWKEHCIEYCQRLATKNRPPLIIWPAHCVKGTSGYKIVPVIKNQLVGRTVKKITKGESHETENYSVFEAEMTIDNDERTKFNKELSDKLYAYDKIYVCGQAKSHCVNYSIRDLVGNGFPAAKLVLLENCMSPVYGFEEMGNKFIEDMRILGAKIGIVTEMGIRIQDP
jgi:nicotinamidase/pyrazinamidase